MARQSLVRSFACAIQGFVYAVRTELNTRIHVGLAVLALIIAAVLSLGPLEWAIIVMTVGVMLAAELANTALECVVDLVSPEHSELAGRAKDISAGAVLTLSVASSTVGLIVFIPALLRQLG